MNQPQQSFEMCEIDKVVKPISRVTTYVYLPKDANEEEEIMEGEIPSALNHFFHFMMSRKLPKLTVDECSYRWYKDPEQPHMTFNIEETL